MSTYQNDDDLFENTYLEIFHAYNPILGKDREAALRRRLGEEEDHLFGDGGAEQGWCRRKRPYIIFGLLLVAALVAILLFFHKEIF